MADLQLSLSEYITYSTVRIRCVTNDGSVSTGTGFIFKFLENPEADNYVPVLITNKHVIKNASEGKLIFTRANNEQHPLDTMHLDVTLYNFESLWRMHPDANVDLCAMPIGDVLYKAEKRNENVFFVPLDKSHLPTAQDINSLSAMESITMVGYPNGLWDFINNKPILRHGITATHLKYDYCGKKEFMIDCACFPGSSGSPVFILNEGSYANQRGMVLGSRLYLLGVLYAGPQLAISGEIKIVDVPTAATPIAVSQTMMNLGVVIKSSRILELENLFMI